MNSSCRLCGSTIMLLNIFKLTLQESKRLRKCIELATGLSILQEDEMGELVCKTCCDTVILSFKYRINAQNNAIRLQNLKSNTATSTTRYINPSISAVLRRYPLLNIPAELYTQNISPVITIRDIKTHQSTGKIEIKQRYRITKLHSTKLSLKKLQGVADEVNSLSGDGDNSFLERITSKDQFVCYVCDKTFKGMSRLNTHLFKYHSDRIKRRGRIKTAKNLILKLVPLEFDVEIQRSYPNLFGTPQIINNTQNNRFESQWRIGPTVHDKQLIQKSILSVLLNKSTKQSVKIDSTQRKNVAVQATRQLDDKYTLDILGTNQLGIVSNELCAYNVPVSFLKQSQLKDTTAFFIQYSARNDDSKLIDWSKLDTIDLQRRVGGRQTSTPLNSSTSSSDLVRNSTISSIF